MGNIEKKGVNEGGVAWRSGDKRWAEQGGVAGERVYERWEDWGVAAKSHHIVGFDIHVDR